MKLPKFILKYYAFNVYNRDHWVKLNANYILCESKVLDVGAGSAPYRDFFSHCNYKTHDFIQLNDNQLRGYNGYSKIDIVSDIENIPVNDNTFDCIICTEVLEHVPEPILAIREMSRILKPGGILLMSAPLGSGLHQEPFHFYGGFTPHFYNKVLNENNLTNISIEPNAGFYSHFSQELIRFIRSILPWKSIINLMLMPFWLFLLPIAIFLPLIAPWLDKFFKSYDFTVGYHIKARKNDSH